MDPKLILEWFGTQLFQFSFAGLLAFGVILMGDVEGVVNKYGVGAGIAAIGVLLGKYFAFRPKTIEAQAAARRSDIQILQEANAEVVRQVNETNSTYIANLKQVQQEHVQNLMTNITELTRNCSLHRSRADRNESMLANSRETKHFILQEFNNLGLQAQFFQMLLDEHKIPHDPLRLTDMKPILKAEDENNKRLSEDAVVTSQIAVAKALDAPVQIVQK